MCPYSFGANTYLLYSDTHAFAVDPCASVQAIKAAADEVGATIEGILLTHGHFDHTVSVDTLREALGVPAYIHEHDAVMLTDGKLNAHFDFYGTECVHRKADIMLHDGDVIDVGKEQLKVIHTPGHTGGCVCFLCDDFIVTGDTLFADSIGRCDLWSGSSAQIAISLELLRDFDGTLPLYSGHGAPSTLGRALDNSAYFLY